MAQSAIPTEPVIAAARALAGADNVLVLTGAGISAESGIPTFREAQTGLWARFSPQDLATPGAFARDPDRVWGWYRWRRTLIARGGVNPGHRALAALETRRPIAIVTQNVDGLHAAAGSQDVTELHGNIWVERCTDCDTQATRAVAPSDENAALPRCSHCGAMTRPGVVWFGEMLPGAALERAERLVGAADCIMVVGTSNQVYPAAALAEHAVAGAGLVIEINPETTGISKSVDIRIDAPASLAIPAILDHWTR